MCGENYSVFPLFAPLLGSPPRVRGKQDAKALDAAIVRITPACAGKTFRRDKNHIHEGDHPRVCGENRLLVVKKNPGEGSPPRVRGKPNFLWHKRKSLGITPACAGKTLEADIFGFWARDHPRVCGENKDAIYRKIGTLGSPPRVRGKRSTFPYKKTVAGITPACAGKTCLKSMAGFVRRDHPRVCGENALRFVGFSGIAGSPPRVRGKPSSHSLHFQVVGITPACAGKTGAES